MKPIDVGAVHLKQILTRFRDACFMKFNFYKCTEIFSDVFPFLFNFPLEYDLIVNYG